MKKTVLYLVILALMVYGVWFLMVRHTNDNPFDVKEAGFTITDTAAIGKLFLAASDGESILVERTANGWVVNQKYKALPSELNQLLTTLMQQRALYPVTKNAFDNALKNMVTDATKVEVYDRSGNKIKVFYVGGASVNNTGTNMMMEHGQTPYVVQVEGFIGYLSPRYSTKLRDWRDRTLLDIADSNVQQVTLNYADKPINSFTISRKGGGFGITGDSSYMKYQHTLNERRAMVYMRYFTHITCEGFLNGIPGLDTVISHSHLQSVLDVTGSNGQHRHLDIYWMAVNKRSKNLNISDPSVPDGYDADRLVAVLNGGGDTVMIQRMMFQKIFRNAYEFFEADGTPTTPDAPDRQPKVLMHK